MTLEELTRKYADRFVNEEKVNDTFTHMGKFGKITAFMFAFETENARVQTELCIKGGKIIGLTPEKEPVEDVWGYTSEEYTEEITPEELFRIDRYLHSVMA